MSNLHTQIDKDAREEDDLWNEHEEDVHEGVVVAGVMELQVSKGKKGKVDPTVKAILRLSIDVNANWGAPETGHEFQ